jgi:hypothetical protein
VSLNFPEFDADPSPQSGDADGTLEEARRTFDCITHAFFVFAEHNRITKSTSGFPEIFATSVCSLKKQKVEEQSCCTLFAIQQSLSICFSCAFLRCFFWLRLNTNFSSGIEVDN